VSVPSNVHGYLTAALATSHSSVPISPFVRSHDSVFPAVVYEFSGDEYPTSTWDAPGPAIVRFQATVLSRSMLEAEEIAQAIVSYAPGAESNCPVRVTSLERDYEPAYDGQRSGMYFVIVNMEQF